MYDLYFFFSICQDGDVLGEEVKLKAVKKKSPIIEENKSKKEHVNVVFIGHVGAIINHSNKSGRQFC